MFQSADKESESNLRSYAQLTALLRSLYEDLEDLPLDYHASIDPAKLTSEQSQIDETGRETGRRSQVLCRFCTQLP